MAITPGTEAILNAAQTWKTTCLLHDGSLFSRETLWTAAHLDELERHFSEKLDMGDRRFLEKFEDQLRPVSASAKRLAAEMLWVMMLFPNNAGRDRKAELVTTVWAWSGSSLPADHSLLHGPLERGIGSSGRAYLTLLWAELVFFISFLQRFKALPAPERESVTGDPWLFGRYIDETPRADKRQLRHMLLHL
jgi:5-methylcytosine-specific restriction protein B